MKEHPILFSGEMVKAILTGRKTQTRRIIKFPRHVANKRKYPDIPGAPIEAWWNGRIKCPYGQPGDRLWVRESSWIAPINFCNDEDCNCVDYDGNHRYVGYSENMDSDSIRCAKEFGVKQTPSIHMPRWASRITLEIDEIRVERLQDITEEDAEAEGVIPSIVGDDLDYLKYRAGFQTLWDSLNIKCGYGWNINPWVWVIKFHRMLEG